MASRKQHKLILVLGAHQNSNFKFSPEKWIAQLGILPASYFRTSVTSPVRRCGGATEAIGPEWASEHRDWYREQGLVLKKLMGKYSNMFFFGKESLKNDQGLPLVFPKDQVYAIMKPSISICTKKNSAFSVKLPLTRSFRSSVAPYSVCLNPSRFVEA